MLLSFISKHWKRNESRLETIKSEMRNKLLQKPATGFHTWREEMIQISSSVSTYSNYGSLSISQNIDDVVYHDSVLAK